MNLSQALHDWFVDDRLQWALLALGMDFVLGVLAALKLKTFRLSYVADFLRSDLIFKVGGWGVLYVASKFAPDASVLPVDVGFDLDALANVAWVIALAALAASILKSVGDLGLRALKADTPLVKAIAGPDPVTPEVPPG